MSKTSVWCVLLIALCTAFWFSQPVLADKTLNVAVTTPDLADIARQIGGSRVKVTCIAKGGQDPHFVETKPSYLRALQQADAFIETGLSLEIGWAPSLLRSARNPKIMPGQPNFLEASAGIKVMDKPSGKVDRSRGDAHPDGNPHYTLNPTNVKHVARTMTAFFKRLDPEGSAIYDKNYSAYWHKIDQADKRWKAILKPYAGSNIVTYHSTWSYFAAHFGLKVCGNIEPKPGVSPSSRQLNELVELMKGSKVKVIVFEPWYPENLPNSVAQKSGASALKLPIQPGSLPNTSTYLDMMEYNVNQLAKALK
ncbi:MAG: metal ABC transporter substrate-binding protein [Candidatus Bruticola sp.]